MAKTINLGKVGLTFGGDYDSSKDYASRTCVFYNHVSWASKKDVPAGIAPGTNDAYWQKVSERGAQGIQGERGPQGNSAFDGTGIELVNNLTEGGEASALSAEQGKILKAELTELETETDKKITELETEGWNVKYKGNDDVTVKKSFNLKSGHRYRFELVNTTWGLGFIGESDLPKTIFSISHRENDVLVYDYRIYNTSGVEAIQSYYDVDAIECDSNNQYSVGIKADIGEEVVIIVRDITLVQKANQKITNLNQYLEKTIKNIVAYSGRLNSDGKLFLTAVRVLYGDGTSEVIYADPVNHTEVEYGSLMVALTQAKTIESKNSWQLEAGDLLLLVRESGSYRPVGGVLYEKFMLELTAESISTQLGNTDKKVTQLETETDKKITELESRNYSNSVALELYDDSTLITGIINRDFYIEVREPYRIYKAMLFREDGSIANDNFFAPTDGHDYAYQSWEKRMFFAVNNATQPYRIKVLIRRADGGIISNALGVIKEFGYFDQLNKLIPNNSGYSAFSKRLRQVLNIRWTPIGKIPSDEKYLDNSDEYYRAGKEYQGIPYSSVKEYDRFVPVNISYKTFLSAVNNPKSVLYTENTLGASRKSAYGIVYNGVNCSSYYGCVCNTLVSLATGLERFDSNQIPNMAGFTEVLNPDASNVQPMDFIWYSGHISLISDIYTDEFGEVKFVCWAEQNIPTGRITAYTPELFAERLSRKGCRVFRWNRIGEDKSYYPSDFTQLGLNDYPDKHIYNEDICTYLGDDAIFVSGEKIYLNVRKGNYSMLQLYRNDALIQTIDITDKEIDNEGFVNVDGIPAIDITSYCNQYGDYKAKLSNADGDSSDASYFHVIEIELEKSGNSGELAVEFNVSENATPFKIERQSILGSTIQRHELSDIEIANGNVSLSWDYSSGDYLKIFVISNNLQVTKRIEL